MTTPTFAFPVRLSEKYRPRKVAEFVGLAKAKRVLAKFAANPYRARSYSSARQVLAKLRWLWPWQKKWAPNSITWARRNATWRTLRKSAASASTFH